MAALRQLTRVLCRNSGDCESFLALLKSVTDPPCSLSPRKL
jgi:hypothetical protein